MSIPIPKFETFQDRSARLSNSMAPKALWFAGRDAGRPFIFRQKYLRIFSKHWNCLNTYDANYKPLPRKSGVYFFVDLRCYQKNPDIVYVGSATNLFLRYKSHNIPQKITETGGISVLFFLEMKKGFYDREIRLISKLQPKFNKQHKKNV